MSKVILLVLFVFITSCGKNAYLSKNEAKGVFAVVVDEDNPITDGPANDGDVDNNPVDNTPVVASDLCQKDQDDIFLALSGEWTSGCQEYVSGHSLISTVNMGIGGKHKVSYELFRGTNCQSPEAKITYEHDMKTEGCLDNTSLIKMNYVSRSTEFIPQSASYTNYIQRRSECGITNWTQGQAYDLTGERCTFLLSTDPFHDTYRKDGEVIYSVLKVNTDDNSIHIADWTSNSGDNEQERIKVSKNTREYILRKI